MSYKCRRCNKKASTKSALKCYRCDEDEARAAGYTDTLYTCPPTASEISESSLFSGGGGDFGGGGASGSWDSGSSDSGSSGGFD